MLSSPFADAPATGVPNRGSRLPSPYFVPTCITSQLQSLKLDLRAVDKQQIVIESMHLPRAHQAASWRGKHQKHGSTCRRWLVTLLRTTYSPATRTAQPAARDRRSRRPTHQLLGSCSWYTCSGHWASVPGPTGAPSLHGRINGSVQLCKLTAPTTGYV